MNLAHKITDDQLISGGVNMHGIEEFKNFQISVSYAKKLSANSALHLTTIYNQQIIREFGKDINWDISIGFHKNINEDWSFEIAFVQLLNFIDPKDDQRSFVAGGIKYSFSKFAKVFMQASTTGTGSIIGTFGMDYQVMEGFKIQISTSTFTGSFGFGAYLELKNNLELVLSSQTHSRLGNSFGFGISFSR